MDFAAAGLLDGLEGDERAAREQLLERLSADGFSLEELKAAAAEDRLTLLPLERILGGRYTAADVEQQTGLPAGPLRRMWRLLGLPEPGPDDRVFADEDVEAARALKLFLDAGIREDSVVDITRVLGEGMARLAATTAAAFVEAFLRPGDSEPEVALRFVQLAEELKPAAAPVLLAAYDAHLREAVKRGMIGRAERRSGHVGDAQEVTVCFADLVGFTTLGGEVDAEELGTVAGKFAQLATEVTEPPVRLVKTIGDAAMFVSSDPAAQVRVALSLLEAVNAADLPTVRAGIAAGPAIPRAGDFYGHAVNLASRITAIARPGSVLCSEEVKDAVPDGFEWSFARRHRLKGIGDAVPLYRARRLQPAGDERANRLEAHDSRDGAEAGRSAAKSAPRATKPTAGRRRKRASS